MGQTLLEAIPAADRRHDVKEGVVLGDRKVVHHAVVRRFEPDLANQLAAGRDLVVGAILGAQSGGGIAEGNHVAGPRIDLRMRRKSLARHLAVEGRVALRLEGHRVHHECRRIFLQGVQLATMNPSVGVGRAANLALDQFIVRERIAVRAEQSLAGGIFELPFVGSRPALLEIAPTVVDMEARDHAIAIERDVVAQAGWKLRIRLHAVESAVQFPRNGSLVDKTYNVRFDAGRGVEAREAGRIGEMSHDASLTRSFVSYTNDYNKGIGWYDKKKSWQSPRHMSRAMMISARSATSSGSTSGWLTVPSTGISWRLSRISTSRRSRSPCFGWSTTIPILRNLILPSACAWIAPPPWPSSIGSSPGGIWCAASRRATDASRRSI